MTKRQEFSKKVYAEIVMRATVGGVVACEGCGLILGRKPYHVDHEIPDAMRIDKSKPLTAKDGKLLGQECCHADKTKQDVKNIAKAKRVEAKDKGIKRPKSELAKTDKPARDKSTKIMQRTHDIFGNKV